MSSRTAFSRAIAFKILTVLACASPPAQALEGMSLMLGNGDGVDMGRVGLTWWSWKSSWPRNASWHVGGYFEGALGYWHYDGATAGQYRELYELALTPVLRVQPNDLRGPYVEAGLGAHLLSHTSIGDTRMSTGFQFGNHIGLGYRFGPNGSYDLGYRFQHLSNASIKRPNSGINFHQIRLQHTFQ